MLSRGHTWWGWTDSGDSRTTTTKIKINRRSQKTPETDGSKESKPETEKTPTRGSWSEIAKETVAEITVYLGTMSQKIYEARMRIRQTLDHGSFLNKGKTKREKIEMVKISLWPNISTQKCWTCNLNQPTLITATKELENILWYGRHGRSWSFNLISPTPGLKNKRSRLRCGEDQTIQLQYFFRQWVTKS